MGGQLKDTYFCDTEVKSDFNKFIFVKDNTINILAKYDIPIRIVRKLKSLNGVEYYHIAVNHIDYQKSLSLIEHKIYKVFT